MKKFTVKFVREFEVEVQAEDASAAKLLADRVLTQFPKGTTKLLSLVAEDYVESKCAGCAVDPLNPHGKPRGNPDGGGSPGTPVIRIEELADQVAEAA